MATIQNPQRQCWLFGPSDVKQASELFTDLGIKIVSGGQFLGGFVGDDTLAAECVSVRYRCGPAVSVSWLMWLFLNLRLLMLHWPDLYSLNGLISRERFLIVLCFSSTSGGFE